MHHSSKKSPPKNTPFLAYVCMFIDHTWTVCVWSVQHKAYIDDVMKQDIGNDFWWIVDLPEPMKLMAATKTIAQLTDVSESAQLQMLLKEILIYQEDHYDFETNKHNP